MPLMKATGKKTASNDSVVASTAKPISLVARMAAGNGRTLAEELAGANAPAAELFLNWQATQTHSEAGSAPPNLFRFLFFNPQARVLIENWAVRSQRLVAEFRADCGGRLHAAPLRELIDELLTHSPEFAALWKLNDVQEREGGERGFQHPLHGRLVYEQLTLRAALHPEYKLVMLLPMAAPA